MSKNNMENFKKFMSGKGYYIALILCAIAIGISGYMYYRTANEPQTMAAPDASAAATQPGQDVPVIDSTKLQPGVPTVMHRGQVLALGSPDETFTLMG